MKSFHRILSLIVALATIASTMVFSAVSVDADSYTPEQGVIVFDSQEDVDKFVRKSYYTVASNGVSFAYDEVEDALRVEVTGSDPYVYFNYYDGLSKRISCNDISYFYVVYKSPRSNSATAKASNTRVYLCTAQSPVPSNQWLCYWDFSSIFADQYTIGRMDVGSRLYGKGNFYGFRYDFFQDAQVGDVIYIDSVIVDTNKISGVDIAGARTALKNGYPIDPATDYLCREYDIAKYTSPYWKGNVVFNEAVCPIANDDGSYTYTLMYEPDEILYVYDGAFSRYFEEGVDFTVSGNKLTVLESGKIDRFTLDQAYSGDKLYFESYLNVTYTHSDTWDYVIPETKADKLPNTTAAIKNNEDYNVVFFGDSIAGGANASSYRGFFPNAPYWWEQIEDSLRESYGFTNLNVYDVSEGGSTASGMIGTFNSSVLSCDPDLIFIEFGVNDAQNGETSGYKNAIETMIKNAKAQNSECEIVLVSPFYSNTNVYSDNGFEVCQKACLELEEKYEGVACADITAMHKSLREVKRHYDITGDNVCHPNDYFSRIYAQVCLATIIPEELGYEAYVPVSAPILDDISVVLPEGGLEPIELGGELDLTKLSLKLMYDKEEANTTVAIDPSWVSGFDSETVGEKTVRVTYKDFYTEFKVTVYDPVIKGDADGDGDVTLLDLFKLKLFIKQKADPTAEEIRACDIDGDGELTMIDSFEVKYRVAKGTWRE